MFYRCESQCDTCDETFAQRRDVIYAMRDLVNRLSEENPVERDIRTFDYRPVNITFRDLVSELSAVDRKIQKHQRDVTKRMQEENESQ